MDCINTEEKIYRIVTKLCNDHVESIKDMGANTQHVASILGLKRNFVSRILNELYRKKRLVKINTRPVLFISKEILEKKLGVNIIEENDFQSVEEMTKCLLENSSENVVDSKECIKHEKCFNELIGYDGSLRYQVEQCKAAIRYPNNGLPILITGPTGSGKSFIAELMYRYAKSRDIVQNDAKFLIFNCAEYANNPELLSANLFGYVKGAFTGAERDTKGIIEEADEGFLFLDEIHRLPPEGQEKLFLFMDKGIFRRLGENRDFRIANVRFIFATTEKIENFLISTFLRRIPIVVNIPSLAERPLSEKFNLIYTFFEDESKALSKNLIITKQALKTLLYFDYKGNIGQLRNSIKLSCAQAYNNYCNNKMQDENIEINFLCLPDYLTKNLEVNKKHNIGMDFIKKEIIITKHNDKNLEMLESIKVKNIKEYKKFYDELLKNLKKYVKDDISELSKISIIIDNFFDKLSIETDFTENQYLYYEKFDTIHTIVHDAFELIKNKYDIEYYDSIGYKISCYIVKSIEQSYFLDISGYDGKFTKYLNIIKDKFKQEYVSITKLSEFLSSNADIELSIIHKTILTLYLKGINKTDNIKRIKAVIIAHGYYTASSIANVANYLLGENIFEPFDMPVKVKTEVIVKKLKKYLEEVDISKGLIILVDMGSLEEIYEGLEGINYSVIGIVNNITTQLALDTGNSIMRELSVEDIVKKVTLSNKSYYQIIKPKGQKPNVLIVTCITGIGTARKIKNLLLKSLGNYSDNIRIVEYEYLKLKNNGHNDSIFKENNVLAIMGTKDPKIEGVPFFSLEDVISGGKEQEFINVLKPIISEKGIQQINQSILKYFSLEGVLNYITILNPNKIIDQIELAINSLQYQIKEKFTNEVKISLYVHLSCLIERLVTHTQIDDYSSDALVTFTKCHQDFIKAVKKSFSVIEKLYSVSIPIAEIYFIYEILSSKMWNSEEGAK